MKFNLSKCKVMHTGKMVSQHTYQMDGQELVEITKRKTKS